MVSYGLYTIKIYSTSYTNSITEINAKIVLIRQKLERNVDRTSYYIFAL